MKTIWRFVTEHPGLSKGILFLAIFGLTVFTSGNEHVSFLTVYLIDLFILFLGNRFIGAAPGMLLQEPLEILEQKCDPYPFLEEMERQMARNDMSPQRQITEVHYATALRMVGQNQRCADILDSINIDRYIGVSPQAKFVYYNNLSDVLFALGRMTEAEIWHKKALRIYDDLPAGKIKNTLTDTIQISEAEALYYQQEYDKALRKVAWISCKSTRTLLDAALLAAKCHIAMEEPEKAKEKLKYVAENGNRLYIAEEASALLETLG